MTLSGSPDLDHGFQGKPMISWCVSFETECICMYSKGAHILLRKQLSCVDLAIDLHNKGFWGSVPYLSTRKLDLDLETYIRNWHVYTFNLERVCLPQPRLKLWQNISLSYQGSSRIGFPKDVIDKGIEEILDIHICNNLCYSTGKSYHVTLELLCCVEYFLLSTHMS